MHLCSRMDNVHISLFVNILISLLCLGFPTDSNQGWTANRQDWLRIPNNILHQVGVLQCHQIGAVCSFYISCTEQSDTWYIAAYERSAVYGWKSAYAGSKFCAVVAPASRFFFSGGVRSEKVSSKHTNWNFCHFYAEIIKFGLILTLLLSRREQSGERKYVGGKCPHAPLPLFVCWAT